MSPEQARGKRVDQRADIWAFGCVLYEMLTGQPAFGGEDVTIVLAGVLDRGANLDALPAELSPAVRQTIKLCLQKDSKKRVADIRDVKLALAGAFEIPAPQTGTVTSTGPRERLAWMTISAVAVLVAVALAVPAVRHLRETPPPETRLDIVTPATDQPAMFALSPDGRQIVFVASGDGESRLWVRSLATTTAEPLAGTDGATWPFWSPDGRRVVVARTVQGDQDLWLLDGARTSRLTFDPAVDTHPVWSPDGTRTRVQEISTRHSRTARARRSGSSPPTKTWLPAVGPGTGAFCCI
jgi:eukaryotic-like serine/threonine-protein kinase